MSGADPGAALVTGAARRIGRAVALAVAGLGRPVAVHYRGSRDEALATAAEIERRGGRAAALAADLTREDETRALIDRAAEALGPVEVLVNNASVFERDSLESASRESWDRHLETNLRAPFVLTQRLAAALPEGRRGAVVNLLDERVWNLTPHFMSYTLSKAGLWALTRTTALALAPRIRVNAVGPGPALPSPRQTRAQFDRQAAMMPLGRGATPEEIAEAVVYVIGAAAMTGQMIALDGGQHLGWAQPAAGAGPVDE